MHQINLPDPVFAGVQQRAAEAGFANVDDFVVDILVHHLEESTPDLDHFFTPARMALIEQSMVDVEDGNVLTLDQVKSELAAFTAQWRTQHPDLQ